MWFERLDAAPRQWPVAGTALLALAVILAAAMLAGEAPPVALGGIDTWEKKQAVLFLEKRTKKLLTV